MALAAQSRRTKIESAEAWFEDAFQQHWSRIYAVLYRLMGDSAEAEDLALETFWRLYQHAPNRQPKILGGWLYRVAVNLGLNALRSRRRRLQYENKAGALALEEHDPADPARAVEREQERQLVRLALASMKPRSAALLILRYSEFSYAEIAETLGLSATSIGTLLARAEAEFERRYRQLEGG